MATNPTYPDREERIQTWLDNLNAFGGKVLAIDFTKYYLQHFCDDRGRPTALIEAIEELRKLTPEQILEYQELDFNSDERFTTHAWAERSIHMIWLLQQEQIVYKPSVTYNANTNDLRILQGGGRVISLYAKTKQVPVIYIQFPDTLPVEFPDAVEVTTASEFLDAVMLNGETYDDLITFDILDNSIYREDDTAVEHKYPNYACSGSLNASSQISWQSKASAYKTLIDEYEDVDSAVKALMYWPINGPGIKW